MSTIAELPHCVIVPVVVRFLFFQKNIRSPYEKKSERVDEMNRNLLTNNALSLWNNETKNIRLALDLTSEVTVTDPDGNIIYANDKFCELSKYSRDELIGKNHRIIKSGHHSDEVYKELWDTISQGKIWHNEIKNKAKDGSFYWADSTIVPFLDENGIPYQYVAIRHDITRKKEYEEAIRKLELENRITNLPNNKSLEKRLNILCQNRSKKFALIFFSINQFKYITDHYGFYSGDKILIEMAKLLSTITEGKQYFISHYNNEEFIILLHDSHLVRGATQLADDIFTLFEKPVYLNEQPLYISGSIGISFFPTDGLDGETLIQKAGLALHSGKNHGINQYHLFNNIMDVESFKTFNLQNDLRKAMENEEFFIEYQPKVDTMTHKIISAEALVRWDHPKWGVVPPNEFIHLAETSGIISTLGDWILKRVCLQINEWKKKGLNEIPIAVNFSPMQISERNITDRVIRIIQETGVNPHYLELEITENGILQNYQDIMMKMMKLRKEGISFSIDDFGTGYSSLKTLNQLQFDFVKIDRSFIKDLTKHEGSLQITKTIIQLAHLLNIKVIAEGVETSEQLEILKKLECDFIQGYYFSRPVNSDDFETLLAKGIATHNIHSESDQQSYLNRRKYFRILFKYPLEGTLTVHVFNSKPVQIGSSSILIEDIGPGGLCFVTTIKFPLNKGLILGIGTTILGQTLTLQGHNVWCRETDEGLYQYGFEFEIQEKERSHLLSLLNQLQVQYKKDVFIPSCSFIKLTDTAEYFNFA